MKRDCARWSDATRQSRTISDNVEAHAEARRPSPGQATIRPAKISLIRAQHRTAGPTASCTSLIRRLRTLTPPNNRSRYSLSKNGAGVKLVSRSAPTSAAIARWF